MTKTSNNKVYYEEKTHTREDADGNVIEETKDTVSRKVKRVDEPDYIKVYTKMWSEFTGIPEPYHELFFQLAIRMTYCNSLSLKTSQIVYTGKPVSDDIMATLHWKQRMYQRGLSELKKCGAIRQIARGVYQINPAYAGKGEWCYNPKLKRGGVEDLVAEFRFKDGEVRTKILWADDGSTNEINKLMRQGTNSQSSQSTVMKSMDYFSDIDDTFKGVVNE